MKARFLLAGAAALTLPYSAQAADAVVVAEPEPVEYVRVCDVYGPGFYYIPGTETCLRVGGYLRYDIGVGEYLGADTDPFDGDDEGDTYFKRARFALRADARAQTELGVLRSYAQINFDYDTGAAPWSYQSEYGKTHELYVNHAYLELGGFRVGVTDSVFSSFTDFAGNVANDWLLSYGPFQTNQIAYTYVGENGFAATIATEAGEGDFAIDSYVPHLVAGASLTQGWGKMSAIFGYDSVTEESAGKVRLDVRLFDRISVFGMLGYKTDDSMSYYGRWGGDWAVWAGTSMRVLNDRASFNTQFSYDDLSNFVAVANIEYEVVQDFRITPEIVYVDNFDVDGDDSVNGFLRFQHTF